MVIARQRDDEESFMVTDARALYDLFHRRSGAAGLCRRAQIDMAVMASSAQLMNAPVYWIPGIYMIADCLTKRAGNSTLMRKVMLSGLFALQPEPLKVLIDTASDAPPDGCDTDKSVPEFLSLCFSCGHAVQCECCCEPDLRMAMTSQNGRRLEA